MIISKFAKALVIVACMTVFSSTAAFADTLEEPTMYIMDQQVTDQQATEQQATEQQAEDLADDSKIMEMQGTSAGSEEIYTTTALMESNKAVSQEGSTSMVAMASAGVALLLGGSAILISKGKKKVRA